MSPSLSVPPARSRLLSGILTVLAVTSPSACVEEPDDDRVRLSENVSYQPGRNATRGGDPMPGLPCLPPSDARIRTLTYNCSARDFQVLSGPVESFDENGASSCNYVLSYTTPRGASCIVGRPLRDEAGVARTAALGANAAWSV